MVHWDCDADLSKDHKSSNERLVEIVCENNGALLKEWVGKGSGDGKKEPLCRQVLTEFQAQGVTHRKTTRDIRNAITQLVKRYEAAQMTIKNSGKGNDVVYYVDGKPRYPQGREKFESCMRTRFPFYRDLREYLGDMSTSSNQQKPDDEKQTTGSEDHYDSTREVDSLQVTLSEPIKKTTVRRRKRQSQAINDDANDRDKSTHTLVIKRPVKDVEKSSQVTFASDETSIGPSLLATDGDSIKRDHHKLYMELKRRKIEIQQHETLIKYQSRAIELMAQHCNMPEDKEELRQMVKTFSQNAFPSLSFSTHHTQFNEEDELFNSDSN